MSGARGRNLVWVATLGAAVLVGVSLVASGGSSGTRTHGHEAVEASGTPSSQPPSPSPSLGAWPPPSPTTPTETLAAPEPVTATIAMAGDVLPHTSVLRDAETGTGWDFSSRWEAVTPWISAADLALCHLEVPIAPGGVEPSGYPLFGSPAQLATDLAQDGWDGCSTASNHALDRGWDGVVATLEAMDAAGLGHAGTGRTEHEATSPQWYELDRAGRTVRIAHLSASYGTNGLPLPPQAPWSVQLIDSGALIAQAQAARADGADVVLVSLHWGVEYTDAPAAEQTEVAQALAATGQVDLVIGTHPHVPQPIQRLDGGPDGAGMWVAYSLGNYLSDQDERCCRSQTGTGLLGWASLEVPAAGPVRVTGVEWTAVTVDRVGGHRVYPMPDLLARAIQTPALTLSPETVQQRQQQVVDVLAPAPERIAPPLPSGPGAVVIPAR